MSSRGLTLLAVLAAWGVGCSCGPTGSGLAITVTFEAGSPAKCAIVGVQKESGAASFESKALPRPTDNSLIVGVERTADIRGRLVPFARAYASSDCSGAVLEQVQASSAFNLDLPGRQEVTLILRGATPDGGMDDGGTGDAGPGDGGCVPSSEVCSDGLDNDCDGLADCLDPSCGGLGCNDNDGCTNPDLCRADGGCEGAAVSCTNPGQCEVAPGACAGGVCGYDAGVGLGCNTNGICRSDKSCADGGEVFCANALDDDTDLLTDCADPDCANQACDAGPSTCFLAAACVGTACTPTAPIVCTPPGQCFVSTGACVEGTGCPFGLRDAGAVCDGGFCRTDGGCGPVEACANGLDDDFDLLTDCQDPDCNTLACDDNNGCTLGTVCSAGVCGGGAICPSTSTCSGVGSCGTDGGCQYAAPPLYARCDGGFCRADGTCGKPFPYTPSNFDPGLLSVPDASVKIDCEAEFDSDIGGNGGFASWCGPRPLVFIQPQAGADDVVVLAMPNLEVTDGGGLYLTGARPVVLAVFGSAAVGGRIVAAPRPGNNDRGAGGSLGFPAKSHCTVIGTFGKGGDGISGNFTSGGGGGGAFGAPSGPGGIGATLNSSGGAAAVANGNPQLVPLRGGCSGGYGGSSYLGGPAAGGYGGGAVQLSVAGSLFINGYVAAPGLGGKGGDNDNNLNAGGGGAGSGGAVLLEATALRLSSSALISALGGGGGEGDGDPNGGGEAGDDGQDGHVSNTQLATGGSTGSTRGGNGGAGGVGVTAAAGGDAGTAGGGRNGGGGGGGASVGRIRFNILTQCTADAGIISPLFTGTCP
ncbi:MAG: hypothetical protein H6Q89_2778 [Myxococcaceae bacterium]|nr:hypothetical protein [Myxococcaceae bacterium]